jgi:orotidine-5'-phosphate decarboxylase
MATFPQTFKKLLKEKNSVLCIGLDPALPYQRSKNVIPQKYLKVYDENEARLNFCLDIVEQVNEFCIAAKPNQQYLLGLTKKQHQKLTGTIKKAKMLSILDYKLNDIRDTVETINIAHESVMKARGYELGIIVLTLTSNPEAIKYMKLAIFDRRPIYKSIAQDISKYNADGAVIGATGHVTQEDITYIRRTIGEEKIILFPGIGTQEGDPEKVIKAGQHNILINVGRDIIYADSPVKKAQHYYELFRRIRE